MKQQSINIENIYKFLAITSLMNEYLVYCKEDLINIQKINLDQYVDASNNRKQKRFREKEANENLLGYVKAIERIYNSSNRIIETIENTEEGKEMINSMIDNLNHSLKDLTIEIR